MEGGEGGQADFCLGQQRFGKEVEYKFVTEDRVSRDIQIGSGA